MKIIIFGNSGSGKSTLAKQYSREYGLAHLDLDTLAWQATSPPTRKSIKESAGLIDQFLERNQRWVIEGCYADLLSLIVESATEMFFLNPGVEVCIENCKRRPWEPHKYKSQKEQNQNLEMLIEWIKQYPVRNDEFSLTAHQKLFSEYSGKKTEYRSNERNILEQNV